MGIDRPDVDAVVHFSIPGSVEAYYQEIGRAGRDGRAATATLLWDPADVATREFLIDSPRREKPGRPPGDVDPAEMERRKAIQHKKLERMIEYATTRRCLRAAILSYFGDPAVRDSCTSCANCQPQGRLDAYDRDLLRKILSGIARAGERYGRRKIVAMLVGETARSAGAPDEPIDHGTAAAAPAARHRRLDRCRRCCWPDCRVDRSVPHVEPDGSGPGRHARTN
jgi:ATP-dependent DNA helicase RecQ